ncbi:MAG: hypothetical protein AABX71_02780 [Nanoarchaeota archaeon]
MGLWNLLFGAIEQITTGTRIPESGVSLNPHSHARNSETYTGLSSCPKCGSNEVEVGESFDSDNVRTIGTYCKRCGLVD